MSTKIGVGIITCNRPDYLKGLLDSLVPCKEFIDELVIVNDGDDKFNIDILGEKWITKTTEKDIRGKSFSKTVFKERVVWLQNETNLGVGKSKNKALKHLLDKKCDYIFVIEDDMIILNKDVFAKYIQAHKLSGIHHFNYGPGSPFNRKQDIQFDLHNRHLLKQDTDVNPKLIIEYSKDIKVALYEHTVAMFSFFTREVLEKVGLIDEEFYNAWEHVDHTYRIIKAGYHPPFWWFADLADSHKLLTEAPGAIDNSSIANKTEEWAKNVYGGREIYLKKHGHYPNQPPYTSKELVLETIKKLKNERV